MKKLLFAVIMFLGIGVFAQSSSDPIDPTAFNSDLFNAMLQNAISRLRIERGLDTMLISGEMNLAAAEQLKYISQTGKIVFDNPEGKKASTKLRVGFFGGNPGGNSQEIITDYKIVRGKSNYMTYQQVLDEFILKSCRKKDVIAKLFSNNSIYFGIGSSLSSDNKKLYISVVTGDVSSLSLGHKLRKTLPVKFTKKALYSEMDAKASAKTQGLFADYQAIRQGLYVENGKIYLKYNNTASLNKFLSEPLDGIVVEIVQKAQYPCDKGNIIDYTLNTRGLLLKPLYQSKIQKLISKPKKNRGNAAKGEMDIVVGKFPKKLTGEYEFNVMFLKNGEICRYVKRTFNQFPEGKNILPVSDFGVTPDTVFEKNQNRFKPAVEQKTLTFKIPFEKAKYNYRISDIEPFIKALGEPKFTISKVKITVHSSIEADSIYNSNLRKQRAQSILAAVDSFFLHNKLKEQKLLESKDSKDPKNKNKTATKKINKKEIEKIILEDDSWKLFCQQVQGTRYAPLAKKSLIEVNNILMNDDNLQDSLEQFFVDQRFAIIEMSALIDYSKEPDYINQLRKYNAVIATKNANDILYMQKNLILLHFENKIPLDSLLKDTFDLKKEYVNTLINQMWLKKLQSGENTFNQEDCDLINKLYKLNPKSEIALFNHLVCKISLSEYAELKEADSIVSLIEQFYNSPKVIAPFVDAVNLDYHLDVIKSLEKQEILATDAKGLEKKNKELNKYVKKLKSIFKPEFNTWQNAFVVAAIYNKYGFSKEAYNALKPFVAKEDLDMDIDYYIAFISIAGQDTKNLNTKEFRRALDKIREKNPEFYCKLFGNPNSTFQLLDDPMIKKSYCESCNK